MSDQRRDNALTVMEMSEVSSHHRGQLVKTLVKGALMGLTWGASLRAWMVMVVLEFGGNPEISWSGTFLIILLPSALMGALLYGASLSTPQGKNQWRWSALSPLLLVLSPLLFMEDFVPTLISSGMGAGALGVALIGVAGGYGFSHQKSRWPKRIARFLTIFLVAATVIGVYFLDQRAIVWPTAEQTFGIIYFFLLMVLLIAATSIPYREC